MSAGNPAAVGDLIAYESKRQYKEAPTPWFVARVAAVNEDGYVSEVEGKDGPTPLTRLCYSWYLIPAPMLKESAPIDEALNNAWVSREAITALLKPHTVDDYEERRDALYEARRTALRVISPEHDPDRVMWAAGEGGTISRKKSTV